MTAEFDTTCFEAIQALAGNETYRKAVTATRQKWLAVDRQFEAACAPLLDKVWGNLAGADPAVGGFQNVPDTSVLPPYFGNAELPSDAELSTVTQIGGIELHMRGASNIVAAFLGSKLDVAKEVSERDFDVLNCLQRVSTKTLAAPAFGFEVSFTFSGVARNYISDSKVGETAKSEPVVLRLSCICDPVDISVIRFETAPIQWKKDCNPTVMQVDTADFADDDDAVAPARRNKDAKKGKQGKRDTKPKSTIQTIPCPSFFNIFEPYNLMELGPDTEPRKHSDKAALAEALEQFHCYSATLPMHSFWMPVGDDEDDEGELDGDFGDEEFEEGEDEEDDDDDEEEEEEEETAPPAKKKSRGDGKPSSGAPPAPAPPGKKPECKQQ